MNQRSRQSKFGGKVFPIVKVCLILAVMLQGQALFGQDILQRMKNFNRDVRQKIGLTKAKPKKGPNDAIERLAHEIDWLENYMDQYGSIVAKHPDVWGESRLTKFRREIEKELASRKSEFALRDNASIRRSDIADLAAALSIGLAADNGNLKSKFSGGDQLGSEIESKLVRPSESELKDNPNAEPRTDTTTSHTVKFKTLSTLKPEKQLTAGSNLEPVIELNQRNRYLNHLMQLRRINEGDDTSDAPGYALNLIRIPVSILPGRATRRGYGAEVTISTTPYTSRTLLPNTFRNLVINDVVDQLGLPIVRFAESDEPADPELMKFIVANREYLEKIVYEINRLQNVEYVGFNEYVNTVNRLGKLISGKSVRLEKNKLNVEMFATLLNYIDKVESAFEHTESSKELKANLSYVTAYFKFLSQHDIKEYKLVCQNPNSDCQLWIVKQLSLTEEEKVHFDKFEKKEKDALKNHVVDWNAEFTKAINQEDVITNLQSSFTLKKEKLPYKSLQLTEIVQNANTDNRVGELVRYKREIYRKQYSSRYNNQIGLEWLGTTIVNPNDELIKVQKSLVAITKTVSKSFDQTYAIFALQSKSRRARLPVPPAHAIEIFGYETVSLLSKKLSESYVGRFTRWNQSKDYERQIHLVDARQFLTNNLDSAYDVISSTTDNSPRQLVDSTIQQYRNKNNPNGETLADLIRMGKIEDVNRIRREFLASIRAMNIKEPLPELCWCLVVEMAVLNKQLNDDIQQMAVTNSKCKCSKNDSFKYYTPMPRSLGRCRSCNQSCSVDSNRCNQCGCDSTIADSVDYTWQNEFIGAADQFCEYVNCRWPIQVFTIDPIHQEQNVSDASVVKRELAIAAALSFAQGKISLSQLTSFQRQFQEDVSTVALNRTQVGFVHGNDTFGWRFSPRIQTRSPQGNIRAFNETLYGRGADANVREAMLEPGIRECTAIVLMPSFVPYCDFDIRTSWHRLDKPTHSDVSMKESMKLSRAIKSMQNSKAACKQFAPHYRDGESGRLLRRVKQLERKLPLQTMQAQIPYENTLGGMELFNNGLTDLAPELVGWYGAPGINIKAPPVSKEDTTKVTPVDSPPTTLFLVGDNLSVHETKIIAGGVEIDKQTLISRQVIQVTIPDTVRTVTIDDKVYVAVYAATPYGVTGHMHIPVVVDEAKSALAETVKKESDKIKAIEKRLAKLEFNEFKWTTKNEIHAEIGFSDSDDCCKIGCIQVVGGEKEIVLSLDKLSRRKTKNKNYVVMARALDAKGKVVGKPFKLFHSCPNEWKNFDGNKQVKVAISKLFEKDSQNQCCLKHFVLERKSSEFEKENTVSFKIETFIAFVEGDGYSTPIRIAEELDLKLTVNRSLQSKMQGFG